MSEEKLTRKQLLARLAYCEFEFGVGTEGFSVKDVVAGEFYSKRGYYEYTDEELADQLAFFLSEEDDSNPIDWNKVDEDYASWGIESFPEPVDVVYLLMDIANIVQHELIEVYADKDVAEKIAAERNAANGTENWIVDSREVK